MAPGKSGPHEMVHGICQAGILEWVAISFSRGSSRPRDRRHLAPLCWGRSSCPRASLPLASLLQGCERGGVCSADAGSWSQFTPPTPPRPAIAAGRWGRLCQCFLGHCSCFWWFPVPAAQSPLWTLGQAALGLGQGWLCPLLQERDRNWPENWVSMLSTITYIQGFDSLCYVVTHQAPLSMGFSRQEPTKTSRVLLQRVSRP